MLLTQIGLIPVEAPVAPGVTGGNPLSNVSRMWTMDLHFVIFQPDVDIVYDYGGHFGHQLAPSMSADINANYYYLVAAGNPPTLRSPLIYPEVDFDSTLFNYSASGGPRIVR